MPSFLTVACYSRHVGKQHAHEWQSASPKTVKTTTTPRVMITPSWKGIDVTLDTIMQYRADLTIVQVNHRITRSLTMWCVGINISSECSAQMGSERAGDNSSSPRKNASSTTEGKGDTMTTADLYVPTWSIRVCIYGVRSAICDRCKESDN